MSRRTNHCSPWCECRDAHARPAWFPYPSYSDPVKTNKRNISVTLPDARAQPEWGKNQVVCVTGAALGVLDYLRRSFARFEPHAHSLDLRGLFLHRCCEGRHSRFSSAIVFSCTSTLRSGQDLPQEANER